MVDPILEDKLNKLYHLCQEIEDKTKQRNALKIELIPLIKDNQLTSHKFAIGDRMIRYKEDKQTDGLTQKFLLKTLTEYFGPENKAEAIALYKFILNKRGHKIKEMIDVSRR